MTSTLDPVHRAATRPTSATLPTRLRPADLLRITDQGVADVLDGRYNHLLPPTWDPVERWSTRLESDDDLDLWLISWTPDRSTDLHDHAGSLGALTVLSGALDVLNDRERRIIRLRFFEGRTQMEVAREIHLSSNKRKEDSGPFLTI